MLETPLKDMGELWDDWNRWATVAQDSNCRDVSIEELVNEYNALAARVAEIEKIPEMRPGENLFQDNDLGVANKHREYLKALVLEKSGEIENLKEIIEELRDVQSDLKINLWWNVERVAELEAKNIEMFAEIQGLKKGEK